MIRDNQKRGIIQLVVIIVIAILILSYFGFDLEEIAESEQSRRNFSYVWGLLNTLWENFLREPILYLWNDIFLKLLWEPFLSNFERILDRTPTDLELNAPGVNL